MSRRAEHRLLRLRHFTGSIQPVDFSRIPAAVFIPTPSGAVEPPADSPPIPRRPRDDLGMTTHQ
jgi:hypothetical protein